VKAAVTVRGSVVRKRRDVKIRKPVRLALILAGLAGGWWAGALLGEHYNAPPTSTERAPVRTPKTATTAPVPAAAATRPIGR
jgi:hypothetical protein